MDGDNKLTYLSTMKYNIGGKNNISKVIALILEYFDANFNNVAFLWIGTAFLSAEEEDDDADEEDAEEEAVAADLPSVVFPVEVAVVSYEELLINDTNSP